MSRKRDEIKKEPIFLTWQLSIIAEERERERERERKKEKQQKLYIYQAIKKKMVSNLSSLPSPAHQQTKIQQDPNT